MAQEMFQEARKVKRWFKVELWGGMKTGKTRGALSFPKPCVIDAERGSLMYAEKYKFAFRDANHWTELLETLNWLEKGEHEFQSLVIDPLTIFWADLVDMQVEYIKNRHNREILTTGDWGIIKRRWRSAMNRLIDLNMHVVIIAREKDEYEEAVDPRTGQEKAKKTGEHLPDIEKNTGYIFDVILHTFTQEDKKKGECRYMIQVDGTRRDEIPKYQTYDLTKKRLYEGIFEPILTKMMEGETLPSRGSSEAPPVAPAAASPPAAEKPKAKSETHSHTCGECNSVWGPCACDRPNDPAPCAVCRDKGAPLAPPKSTAEHVGEIQDALGSGPVDPNDPPAKVEDIKVLMTRAGKMLWPVWELGCVRQDCTEHEHAKFTPAQGKAMIQARYKVESTKELRKPQIDFLFEEFGRVLSGKSALALDEKGIPYIMTLSGVDVDAIRDAAAKDDIPF